MSDVENILDENQDGFSLINPEITDAGEVIAELLLSTGAGAWATTIDRGVHFTPGSIEYKAPAEVFSEDDIKPVITSVEWSGDRSGKVFFVVSEMGVKGIIAYYLALAYGREADPEGTLLDEEGLDAYTELVNILLGQAAQALRPETNTEVNLTQTESHAADFSATSAAVEFGTEELLCYTGQITIEGMVPVDVHFFMPVAVTGFSLELEQSKGGSADESDIADALKMLNQNAALKIKVPVIIVLAEKRVRMEEVQGFSPGSIIEFRKLSGDHLDVCAGNTKFAEGEVVIVNEHFGIQIKRFVDIRATLASHS